MGDAKSPPAAESMDSILKSYQNRLPEFMRAANANVLPTEEAKLTAAQATSPGWAQLQAQIFKDLGPVLSQTGSDISRQQALSQAATDAAVLEGPGRQVIERAIEAQKLADPEYYAQRSGVSDNLSKLFNSIDLSGALSGGETEAIRRGLASESNARGTTTSPSMTETVAGAQVYGGAAKARQDQAKNQLTQALSVATGALPALKSGTDVFQVATGRPSTINTGDSKFMGVNQNIGQEAFSSANNLLNNTTQLKLNENQINADRRDGLDRFNETWSSVIGSL